MDATLLASGTLALIAGIAYLVLAVFTWRRPMRAEYRTAWRLFAAWWASVGVNMSLTGLVTLAAALGARDLALFVTQAYVERLILACGLWALLAYVGFVVSGDRRTWAPAAGFYAAYYLLVTYRLAAGRPIGIELNGWARPVLVTDAAPSALWSLVTLAMLALPPFVAAMLYLRLAFGKIGAKQRARIVVVACGIMLWFTLSIGAYFSGTTMGLQVLNRFAGLAIAAAILWVSAPRRKGVRAGGARVPDVLAPPDSAVR